MITKRVGEGNPATPTSMKTGTADGDHIGHIYCSPEGESAPGL